ncbi:MAG: hypothetical protein HW421_2824 [Ignavibacteria bacterium]|nr:hypothetical protein [Ignavibacteria bacterium]
MNVHFTPKALKGIDSISKFIFLSGYPEMAINFANELYDFGLTLAFFPEKYPICRFEYFAKRKFHCAVYKDYIFIYQINAESIIIYNIIHSRLMQ